MGGIFGKSGSWVVDHTMDEIPLSVAIGKGDLRHGSIASVSTIQSDPPPYDEITTSLYETPQQKKARKRSHWVAYTTMFVMSIGFSIVLSGVWPFLQKLNDGLEKNSLGLIVAANPLGQMVASPFLGLWGNKAGTIRFACLTTVFFFIAGNVMYSLLYMFNESARYWAMFTCRFIVGLSSANVTLCRSYLASSTTLKERTSGIAIIAAAQALGFVVGPAIQALMTAIVPGETVTANGWIIWDKFTSCGWVAASLGLINFVILTPCVFQESYIADKERALLKQKQGTSDNIKLPKPDYPPLVGLLFSFFVSIFIFVLLETLAEPFVSDQYAWDENKCMIVVGVSLSVGGLIAAGIFPLSGVLSKKYDERKVMLFPGFLPLIVGTFLLIPFAGKDIPIAHCNITTMEPMTTTTDISGSEDISNFWHQGVLTYSEEDDEDCTLGCPESQEWCNNVNQLPLPQLAIGYIIVMCGYPLVQSLNMAIFSKILGPKPQGLWMGLLTSVGSLARVLGPIFVALVYTELGTVWCFSILFVGMVLAFIVLILLYPRLVPMEMPSIKEAKGYDGPAAKEKY